MGNNEQSGKKAGYGRTLLWLIIAKVVIIVVAVIVILRMKGLL